MNKSVRIEQMLLFGSRAKGKSTPKSDVDIIVVSPDFRKEKFALRPISFYEGWDLEYPADILCYTPEEIKKKKRKSWGVVQEAFKEGISI